VLPVLGGVGEAASPADSPDGAIIAPGMVGVTGAAEAGGVLIPMPLDEEEGADAPAAAAMPADGPLANIPVELVGRPPLEGATGLVAAPRSEVCGDEVLSASAPPQPTRPATASTTTQDSKLRMV
jgi:hypothetical protein